MAHRPVGIDILCCEAGQMYLCDFGADLPACTLDDDSERASDQEYIVRMLELLFFCGSLPSKSFNFIQFPSHCDAAEDALAHLALQ
jgi:hypothetical protein